MKKTILSLAAAAGIILTGCTSIEATQNFNGLACGTPTEKATCQILIQIPGYYFLGLPVITGDLADGKFTFFTYTDAEGFCKFCVPCACECGCARISSATVIVNKTVLTFDA